MDKQLYLVNIFWLTDPTISSTDADTNGIFYYCDLGETIHELRLNPKEKTLSFVSGPLKNKTYCYSVINNLPSSFPITFNELAKIFGHELHDPELEALIRWELEHKNLIRKKEKL